MPLGRGAVGGGTPGRVSPLWLQIPSSGPGHSGGVGLGGREGFRGVLFFTNGSFQTPQFSGFAPLPHEPLEASAGPGGQMKAGDIRNGSVLS